MELILHTLKLRVVGERVTVLVEEGVTVLQDEDQIYLLMQVRCRTMEQYLTIYLYE